ncbi:MAG: threonine dehydratase [Cyanobacteria bacterium J06635_10]
MLRLKQIFQNTFIRILAFLSVLFRSVFGSFKNIFASLGKSLGFSDSSSVYFVESDQKEITEESTDKGKTPETVVKVRRRPKSNMGDFMKMAEDLTKS